MAKPMPRPGLSFTRTDYGGVILDMQRGDYWRLNPVGAELFATLVDGKDQDLVAVVTGKFDIDPETARRDIEELMERFRELRLVSG